MMFYSVMSSYTVIRCNTIVYSILFFSVLSYHDIGFSWQYKKHEAIACIYIYIERETYIRTYIHTYIHLLADATKGASPGGSLHALLARRLSGRNLH